MKLLRLVITFLFILFGISACSSSPDPGPLAAGNSRIRVHCSGFDLNSVVVSVRVAGTLQQVGSDQNLSCLFSGDVYYDVPVPPSQYNVYIQYSLYQVVNFTNSGVQTQVNYSSYLIPISVNF